MEIKLPFAFNKNPRNFLQRCGYHAFIDPYTLKQSFTRRLSRDFYPRFHIYLKEIDNIPVLDLHLDQKKPSYPGAHAHSGEYDSETVQQEAKRIEGLIKNQLDNQNQGSKPKTKGLFSRLFS